MGFLDRLFCNLTPPPQMDSSSSLKDAHQLALNTFRRRILNLSKPHLSTLAKKKGRLVTQDDYGIPNTEKWIKELDYFCERVLLPDQVLQKLHNNLLDAHTRLISKGILFQEPKDALIEFLDETVDIEIENSEEIVPEYSDDITPEDYEHYCADILNDAGWIAVVTKGSGDQGVDVIAEKDDLRLAIQCKKYSKPVGNKAVQEAYSGGAFYKANACAVVTPTEYTPSAIELADSLGVHLFHHDDLTSLSITSPR